jgi:hypothetical protein
MMSVVALMSGAASAAPFRVFGYQAGGGIHGVAGQGISVDRGGFFVAEGAGSDVLTAGAGSFMAVNEFEFDTHWALDGFGPSARNRLSAPVNNSTMTMNFYGNYGPPGGVSADYNELETIPGASYVVAPNSHIGDTTGMGGLPHNMARAGIAVVPPSVVSTFAPNATGGRSTLNGVFVGRFTIQQGAVLSGGIMLDVARTPTMSDIHDLELGGPAVLFQTESGPQMLALRGYRINISTGGTLNIANASIATFDGLGVGAPFGAADVWDLWVQVVPSVGAAWLAVPAAAWGARRRRG